MDSVTIIRVVSGVLFIAVLAIGVAFIAFLSGILDKCSLSSRTMQPGKVWLLLVPVFNIIWSFFVVLALAKSLGNEFRLRSVEYPEPGKALGLALCICAACAVIPYVNFLTLPMQFVLWIIYWVKMAHYSRLLDRSSSLRPSALGI